MTLANKAGDKASYRYDGGTGVFDITEFSGRKSTIYYFMRYDVAYIGKVRKIVDGEGRDLVGYRYDAKHGGVTRVRDRLGNDRNFEYDANGSLVKVTRRAKGSSAIEPVASFKYGQNGEIASRSSLAADGSAAVTTKISYDPERRPIRISDGRSETFVSYNRYGYPAKVRNHLGLETTICYNAFNMVGSVTDASGIATEYTYSPAGLVTRIVRRDGADVMTSLEVTYDSAGRPVSMKDQDGLVRSATRDELGRIVKDSFPDGSAVEYAYDQLGRRTSVTDENGHRIGFSWSRFGLASRTTAANQLTDYVRDENGLLKEVVSSVDKKADRRIRREYDHFGRVAKVDYGSGETETFSYDAWGRVARHTRGEKAETYEYDHFGRMTKKTEDGAATVYEYDAYGCRTLRRSLDSAGAVVDEERRSYDRYGRLAEIASGSGKVKYSYDPKGRVAKQFLGEKTIDFTYTKSGQLKTKVMSGKGGKEQELKYWYSKSGRLDARLVNGETQKFFYDFKGQLTEVRDETGAVLEKYEYDRAGNVLAKTVKGETTTYSYDAANQLVTATDAKGGVTKYAYDAAGRMVKEGDKTYKYGYLDKVLAVTEGSDKYTYEYHVDGQLATATYGNTTEDFLWDGLALVKRGKRGFVNEPHIGGGNPVMSSDGTTYFNDMLGTTLSSTSGEGASTSSSLTAFGAETHNSQLTTHNSASDSFFTGKPFVPGLGHAFLFRNYRSDLGKWQTADPLGYPDGWNQLAYCNNGGTGAVDLWGGYNCSFINYYTKDRFGSFYSDVTPVILPNMVEAGLCVFSAPQVTITWFQYYNSETKTHEERPLDLHVDYYVGVAVSDQAKKSASFAVGTEVTYTEHDGRKGGNLSLPIYEAVLAHEMGHLANVKDMISQHFNSIGGISSLVHLLSMGLLSAGETVRRATDFWNEVVLNNIYEHGSRANLYTISWFNNSPEWTLVSHGVNAKEWTWRKVE